MGLSSSTSNPERRRRRSSLMGRRPSFGKKSRSTKGVLSTTFSVNDSAFRHQKLNINLATEEELMTLPGITRNVAKNLVEYRQAIGGFKKVEDLALVSGVGAAKLDVIRAEICVSGKRRCNAASGGSHSSCGMSCQPSREESFSSLYSIEFTPIVLPKSLGLHYSSARESKKPIHPVNVNLATVFQLMSVNGINQTVAASIVHYRDKKGPFKVISDLIKVKGFSSRLLKEVGSYLTVDASHDAIPSEVVIPDSMLPSCEATSPPNLNVIFEFLSLHSARPIEIEPFNFEFDSQPALRVGTWNLDELGEDKISNLGVLEVICCTILEQGLSLLAVQEISNKEILKKICNELNNPCIKKVQNVRAPERKWKYACSELIGCLGQGFEHLGFLYDVSKNLEYISSETMDFNQGTNNNPTKTKAFKAIFKVHDGIELCLLNLHLRSSLKNGFIPSRTEELSVQTNLIEALDRDLLPKDNLVVLGDFSLLQCFKYGSILVEKGLTPVMPINQPTNANTSSSTNSSKTTKFFDNIWVTKHIAEVFSGRWSAVHTGLTHLSIPHGWSWGGLASNHYPVWAEFFVPQGTHLEDTINVQKPMEQIIHQNGEAVAVCNGLDKEIGGHDHEHLNSAEMQSSQKDVVR